MATRSSKAKTASVPLPDALIDDVALRFRALAEPARLRILRLLLEGERSVNDVTAALGAGQSNTSRHLQALFEAGLLSRRREGNTVFYGIADPVLYDLCRLMCDSARRTARDKLTRMASAVG
jgi:DNA-binding transcriptional ArsR family regulator